MSIRILSLLFGVLLMSLNPTTATAAERERLVLGGGCFWCIEAGFDELRGVEAAVSGYAGGHVADPSYKQVVSGTTGHAEVVEITYDPAVIGIDVLLDVFFTLHDPTTLNRQGNDIGPQYRSIAFHSTPEQKAAIEAAIARAQPLHRNPVVTEVQPLERFWPAEDYHQAYFELNGHQPYCQLVIAPKIAKFRKVFSAWLKD
ncbi:MAG: peptide-methionine (S)-S-oxide reductase MsrA [Xanthomonadales bacterium]|jgi:peptide-methionine (S)-S-oxide reductase|nr:peptide-methionine (S)-S-oxide reductase MsrA [Xanthomonadales bacterium]